MKMQDGPVIDMTRDGEFVEPRAVSFGAIVARLAAFGALLVVAALAFWMALFIVPVLIILGIAGYAMSRNRAARQMRRY